ncbi:GAF domain-containing protein [Endozoicomonas sp. SCSIO W0465]|uniref:GAF domain-containing protein n=1 Tax=Endozoicomonas sp. SCSIO W0465 TaxID=2918516 RepID=UPI0020763398|nr:GAF domain-containing protein [Endozoicomonas sp. SCSIO W0465]USE38954.1 GAF domain-containing protein [Endozoicomonas sp. SCSIO W0465]
MNLSGYLRSKFIPSQSKVALGETLALSLIGYGLVIWHSMSLPVDSPPGFPWWLLVPLLAGLRYGVVYALVPVLLQAVILPLLPLAVPFYQTLPDNWLPGMLVLAVVSGEFREIWGRRLGQHRAIRDYCQQQLQTFVHDYNLLQYAHGELEKSASLAEPSLLTKMAAVKHRLVIQSSDQPMVAIAEEIMAVLSEYGHIGEGCLLYVNDSGQCTETVLAYCGQRGPFFADDPLIQQGLKKRQPIMVDLIAFSNSDPEHMDLQHSRALMAIPMVASDGRIPAVLAIYQTDPDNLSASYLSFISLIAGYLADALLPVTDEALTMAEFPLLVADDPAHRRFLVQLQYCCRFARVHN